MEDAQRPGRGPPAPDWTDANRSDPGISILELAVWLALALLIAWPILDELRRRRFARMHCPHGR